MSFLFEGKTLVRKKYVPKDNQKDGYDGTPQSPQSQDVEKVDASLELKDKVVCLFFSASWCAPCHHFVPLLRDVYTELVKRGDPLEVIFVSFDKTEEDMMNYFFGHHGNWLALPHEDPFRETLSERYSISVVPKLVVIQPDGEVLTSKGRKDIQDKGVVCMRGWEAALMTMGVAEEDQVEQDNIDH